MFHKIRPVFVQLPRMAVCMLLAVCTLGAILMLAPVQGPVLLYKLAQVFLGAVVGYWVDRWTFPYARPDGYLKREWKKHSLHWPDDQADFAVVPEYLTAFAVAMVRRALVMGGAMLAVGLGL